MPARVGARNRRPPRGVTGPSSLRPSPTSVRHRRPSVTNVRRRDQTGRAHRPAPTNVPRAGRWRLRRGRGSGRTGNSGAVVASATNVVSVSAGTSTRPAALGTSVGAGLRARPCRRPQPTSAAGGDRAVVVASVTVAGVRGDGENPGWGVATDGLIGGWRGGRGVCPGMCGSASWGMKKALHRVIAEDTLGTPCE